MPTLYVRNVPARAYEALQRRALRNGRSLNAEAVAILEEAADEPDYVAIVERLADLARQIDLPADAPRSEELIRRDRDAR